MYMRHEPQQALVCHADEEEVPGGERAYPTHTKTNYVLLWCPLKTRVYIGGI